MIKKITTYLLALLTAAAVTACKEDPFGADPESGTGKLSTTRLMLSISNSEILKSSTPASRAGIELSDFIIEILRDGNVVSSYRYADMPGVIELPTGIYTAKAHLGTNPVADWSAPYYEGSTEPFTIRKDEITEAQTIECKLANVRVSIVFSEELAAVMDSEAKVNVVMGENGSLDFYKNESRSGYFAYIAGSNTLVATFDGMVDGVRETSSRVHTDVAPGTHYRITYTLRTPGEDPNASGNITPGITVNASIELVDIKVNIDPGDDDRPEDDLRPGNKDDDDPPTPPQPGEGPEVTINEGLSFETVNEVTGNSSIKINVSSKTGLTLFNVDIVSDHLTAEELGNVGLSDHLDLVNPGPMAEGLASIGLPVNVGGLTTVDFDISQFMPLLAIFGDGYHKFILTVADESGEVTKVLQLHMNP